jgi:O-antigen ligase
VILGACAGPLLLGLLSGRQADLSLDTETSRERIPLWNDALDLFRAHPVLGVGQGNFERAEGLVAHNSFIQCFVELGWVGGGCFVAGFYLAMRIVLQRLAPNPAAAPLGSSLAFRPYLAAAIAAYVIGMMSLTRSYLVPTYLMLGLATAYSRVRPAAGGAAGPRLSGRLVSELLLVSLAFLAGAFLWIRASVHWQ